MSTLKQIQQYAACVYEPDDWVEIRALRDGSAKKFWRKARDLSSLVPALESLNHAGWNIYVGGNPRQGDGLSSDENVATCRCLFVDFDHIEPADGISPSEVVLAIIEEKGLPAPTMVIFSGHGVHCYWRLTVPITPDQWRPKQERLNPHLGSDPTIKNPERIMRLPGFRNVKAEPVDCFVIHANADMVYSLTDIEAHLPELAKPAQEAPPTHAAPHHTTDAMERKARAVLYAAKWPACREHEDGGRNSAAFHRAAVLLRDFDLSDGDAWEILSHWNLSNQPPLGDDELKQAFESAKKYGKKPVGSKAAPSQRPSRQLVRRTTTTSDPAAELEQLIEDTISGKRSNVLWPWPQLTDVAIALLSATITFIVGSIGSSKSFLLLQAFAWWVESGLKATLLELEEKRDFHLCRVLAQKTGIADLTKPKWVKSNATRVRQLFAEHKEYISRVGRDIQVVPEQPTLTDLAEWIEDRARQGYRLICCDPLTAAASTREPWIEDNTFMQRVQKAADESGASLIFVTHAKKGAAHLPDMDSLAGSAAFARFAQSILWLESHPFKLAIARDLCGRRPVMHNRTLHLLKCRNGEGTGMRLAFNFESGLTLSELGIVVKKQREPSDEE